VRSSIERDSEGLLSLIIGASTEGVDLMRRNGASRQRKLATTFNE
jgi:hypothetical protein